MSKAGRHFSTQLTSKDTSSKLLHFLTMDEIRAILRSYNLSDEYEASMLPVEVYNAHFALSNEILESLQSDFQFSTSSGTLPPAFRSYSEVAYKPSKHFDFDPTPNNQPYERCIVLEISFPHGFVRGNHSTRSRGYIVRIPLLDSAEVSALNSRNTLPLVQQPVARSVVLPLPVGIPYEEGHTHEPVILTRENPEYHTWRATVPFGGTGIYRTYRIRAYHMYTPRRRHQPGQVNGALPDHEVEVSFQSFHTTHNGEDAYYCAAVVTLLSPAVVWTHERMGIVQRNIREHMANVFDQMHKLPWSDGNRAALISSFPNSRSEMSFLGDWICNTTRYGDRRVEDFLHDFFGPISEHDEIVAEDYTAQQSTFEDFDVMYRIPGAEDHNFSTLPAFSLEQEEEAEECCICMEPIEMGDEARRLPCPGNHVFHRTCIDEWMRHSFVCPIDRMNLSSV